ncbi:MAG: acetyl-CoA carboxylase biotin carboxyl carrier protein [Bacteroidota bacterium]
MSHKEIQDLLKLVSRLELSEFKMKDGEFSLSVRTKHYIPPGGGSTNGPSILPVAPVNSAYPPAPAPVAAPAPAVPAAAPAAPAAQAAEAADDDANYVAVKSPMVGTFYRSPAPDKPIYVKVGDTVAVGDTVCIIEAMKLFNEVDSEVSGKIVKVLVEDAQPVEYDQVLFLVDPKG